MKKNTSDNNATPYSLWLMGLGIFCAIGILSALNHFTGQPWLMIAAGSTGLLLFAYPSSPFSQLKNVIGGHILASLIGLACFHWLGAAWWSLAIACAASAMLMIRLNVVHPPAASNPLVVFAASSPWSFVLFPMLFGVIALFLSAKLYWYLHRRFI
ncbi:HPP family protein [Paenalcaligenes faecalis]|uniref:HPP family protein n=1 Tax=Paenalcaligenes faecalis TaxID=2980099 RepID=UPI0022B9B8E3|nr:HPP family protein [Paenalcaligenes faecalis]